ncbi:class I adenylate-forming enzyme family protein [Kitasatospora sp. GAS204B]|uniref:class I adenylate-forming enzyme family protein n=1 Tax=unclassified Kitasatospora TaxID=2633591 RepID=UPI002474A3D7|nr:class I adenylate-forming enzyme family protein [Kitasatospora sp. GAS204B]MDH6117451.1 long-chain acyl-CoA synthetase [Kitasatospora sp. GAS204B]
MPAKILAESSAATLAEFEQDTLRIAQVLRERGVGLGDRVLLKAGNSIAYVSVLFALMHVGASVVMVDQQEKQEATGSIIRRAGTKLVLVDDDAPVPADTEPVYLYELLAAAPDLAVTDRRLDFGAWSDLDDALIMWSSGSTGEPKGIVKNGGRMLKNLERNARHMGHCSDDVLLPLLPFSHQYGLSMVLIAWIVQGSLVIAPYKRADRALRMAGHSGATVLDATPATYRSMLNIIRQKPALADSLGTVRMFCSGAAPLDQSLVERYLEHFGLPLLDSYGSTEAGNVAFATSDNAVSCGQVMDGLRVRVVDDEENEVPAGEVGELLIETPDVMVGYLTAEGGIDPVDQSVFRTGDLGYLDAAGNLFVLGRKFAVHRNGYTLYPEIIERKAATGGCSTRIVPLPDERRGSSLVFFVEDEQQRDSAHWRELLAEVLPSYEQPNRVIVLEQFPLNRNGKPDKRRMTELAEAAAGLADAGNPA